MKPFFSIIIPLYNKEKHIKATLESVLAQTFSDFEVIVVNDGSTDGSVGKVACIKDERIQLLTIENQGVSKARNYGVKKASSDYMVLLDADDLWKPNHLENLKALLDKYPDCGLYATAYESLFGCKMIASDYYKIPKQAEWSGIVADFFESSSINCIASSSSVMVPKMVHEAVGGFNPMYNSGEDIDLWIRIALKYSSAFTNVVSVVIHATADNQASKTSINTRKHLDFDMFTEEMNHPSLKKYLDLNRFSLAIQYRLAGNVAEAKKLTEKIDNANLNAKQQLLLKMNRASLKMMLQLKDLLRKNGLGLSAFR
ncbi:MAG: glycosyltransferase family A protein [Gelidibacter sp.]